MFRHGLKQAGGLGRGGGGGTAPPRICKRNARTMGLARIQMVGSQPFANRMLA